MRSPSRRALLALLPLAWSAVGLAVAEEHALVRSDGGRVTLSGIAPGRPVAVVVMKDTACPACRAQLRSLAERIDDVTRTGGVVVGLTAESPQRNRRVVEQLELPFDVLGDPTGRLLHELDLWNGRRGSAFPGLIFIDACGRTSEVRRGRTPGRSQDQLVLGRLDRLSRGPCRGLEA